MQTPGISLVPRSAFRQNLHYPNPILHSWSAIAISYARYSAWSMFSDQCPSLSLRFQLATQTHPSLLDVAHHNLASVGTAIVRRIWCRLAHGPDVGLPRDMETWAEHTSSCPLGPTVHPPGYLQTGAIVVSARTAGQLAGYESISRRVCQLTSWLIVISSVRGVVLMLRLPLARKKGRPRLKAEGEQG